MTINIHSFSQYAISFFKEHLIRSLTAQQKTILIISSLVIGCVITHYVIGRYCFKAKLLNSSKSVISDQFEKQVSQKDHLKQENVSSDTPPPQHKEKAINPQTNCPIISGENLTLPNVLSTKDKVKKELHILAVEKLKLAKDYTEQTQNELKVITSEEKKSIQYPFQEFITTEMNFRKNLEKLKAYKKGLDKFIKDKDHLKGEMKQKFDLKALRDLSTHLTEFIELLKIIEPFSNKIEKLNIEQLPTFVEIYLTTDFTPLLGIIKTQVQFNEFFIDKKDLIHHLPEIIKMSSPEFDNTIGDIENIAANAFQRIGRYHMTLKELLNTAKPESAIFHIIKLCYTMALAWGKAINEWDK